MTTQTAPTRRPDRVKNLDHDRSHQLASLYDELKARARQRLTRLPSHSLGPTDVVHEAVARVLKSRSLPDQISDDHMNAILSTAIRNVLVDSARARLARRQERASEFLDVNSLDSQDETDEATLRIDGALKDLAEVDERAAKVVELRFFSGLTESEIGSLLEVTERTVRRDWRFARAWLLRQAESHVD